MILVHCVHPTEQPVIRRVHEMHHKHINELRTLTLVDRVWQDEFFASQTDGERVTHAKAPRRKGK